jgi:hypothetical protein
MSTFSEAFELHARAMRDWLRDAGAYASGDPDRQRMVAAIARGFEGWTIDAARTMRDVDREETTGEKP